MSLSTLEFFQALYKPVLHTDACLSLFFVRRGDKAKRKQISLHVPVSDLQRAADTSIEAGKEGADVYFGVCLRRPGLSIYERGGDDDVVYVPGLWMDVDYGTVGHAAKNLPPDAKTALSLLEDSTTPNIVVDSGGGLHAYVIQPNATAKEVRSHQLYIAEGFKEAGYHVDLLADLARVLRVPGTFNYKTDPPRPVIVTSVFKVDLGEETPRVDLKIEAKPTKPAKQEYQYEPKYEGAGETDVTGWLERLNAVTAPELVPLARAVVDGTPFAQPGQRDAALHRICAMMAAIDSEASEDEFVDVLEASIVATAQRDGDWDVEEILDVVREKASRALDRARSRKEEDGEVRDLLKTLAAEAADKKPSAEVSPPPVPESKPPVGPGMPPPHQYIISKGDADFVWCIGAGYKAPIRERELLVRLRDDWFKGGNSVKMDVQWGKLEQIKQTYSTVARHLVSDMSINKSYYDESEETFYEAVCPQRGLTPTFDERVQKWLEILGGDHASKLLDWVATVGRLDSYTSALYLAGATGAGKSLFVKGLARRWKSGPTELKRILESFNEDLAKCPLVFADEEMPTTFHGKPSTAIIRELVTSKSRTLSRKFLPPSDLRGAIRVVIAANNDSLLSMGNERLTPVDLEAFGQRFLHIRCSEDAAKYLREIGGQEFVSSWVDDDIIAKHSLWLETTRQVRPGPRFLVEGIPSILKRILATRGKVTALACEWLARHLDRPNPSVEAAKYRIRFGGGRLLVHAATMVDCWESYIRSDPRPSVAVLSDALKHVSHESPIDVDGLNYYSIDVEMFLDWARDHSMGDVNGMKSRIQGEV